MTQQRFGFDSPGGSVVRPDPAPEPIAELSKVSLKYTSRISDIRKWLDRYEPGTKIINRRDSDRPGVTVYSLQKG